MGLTFMGSDLFVSIANLLRISLVIFNRIETDAVESWVDQSALIFLSKGETPSSYIITDFSDQIIFWRLLGDLVQ